MKHCKNCGQPIRWNTDLQRYEHTDTKYDGCGLCHPGKRAEPMK